MNAKYILVLLSLLSVGVAYGEGSVTFKNNDPFNRFILSITKSTGEKPGTYFAIKPNKTVEVTLFEPGVKSVDVRVSCPGLKDASPFEAATCQLKPAVYELKAPVGPHDIYTITAGSNMTFVLKKNGKKLTPKKAPGMGGDLKLPIKLMGE